MLKLALCIAIAGPAGTASRGTAARADQHRGGGELLWRRGAATGRRQRHRHQHPEQPRPGSASVRGEPVGRARPVGAPRSWSTTAPTTIRGWPSCSPPRRSAEPQGHRRGRPRAQEARRQSASLVRPGDHAGLCQGAGRGARRDAIPATGRTTISGCRRSSPRCSRWTRRSPSCAASSPARRSPPPSRCSATWRPRSASRCATSASSSR